MANEFTIINNPDSTPGLVSSGYQRQNTRASAASNGQDRSVLTVTDTDEVTISVSGGVDVSGTLYACASPAVFSGITAGRYFVSLVGTGSTLTPTIGTDAGVFDAARNGRYTSVGDYRVLDWLIVMESYGSQKLTVLKVTNAGALAAHNEPLLLYKQEISAAGSNTWTAPRSQVYTFELQACGGDGGTGDDSGSPRYWGAGGGGGGYVRLSEFVEAGTVLTLTKSVTDGANNTLTGSGFSTMTAQNGGTGESNNAGVVAADSGAGGSASGGGRNVNGQDGGWGLNSGVTYFSDFYPFGGNAFLGFGGNYSVITPSTNFDGYDYGGGGSGGLASGDNGDGASGVLYIWG